jgi:hypothetical protein
MTTGEGNAATGTSSAAKFNPFVILAGYISDLAKEVIITDYRVRRFSITGGETDYYDHTLEDEFHLNLNHLFFDVQQLNSSMGRASIDFSTVVNKGGLIKAEISVNPKDFMDFDVRYELTNVAVIDYNPYSIFNIAYPFTRGKFNYTGSIVVKNHKIKMDNNVFVEKIYAGKKVKNKTAVSLPVKLALAILRDKKGNITLTVPVEGDLNDPKFKWWKIVVQVLKNLISKAAAAPGNLLASAFGGNEDDFREIKFDYGQDALAEKQLARLENVKKVLDDKPELVVQFNQALDSAKDLEYLTRFEAKKRFYIETRHRSSSQDSLSNEDLININNISITDTGFVGYLDRKLNSKDPMRSTLEKCATLIGKQPLESLRKKRVENRNRSLENYLKTKLNIPENRYAISINSDPKNVPEDNIPRYLISFSVPE